MKIKERLMNYFSTNLCHCVVTNKNQTLDAVKKLIPFADAEMDNYEDKKSRLTITLDDDIVIKFNLSWEIRSRESRTGVFNSYKLTEIS